MKKEAISLIITDTHLNSFNHSIVENIFEEAIQICKRRKIKRIFHLGDFFDTRAYLTYEVLSAANKIFKLLNESGLEVIMLAGNHDRPYVKKDSYLKLYIDHYINISFIDEISYSIKNIDGEDILISYLPNWDKCLNKKLKENNLLPNILYEKKILLAHHQFTEIPSDIQAKFDLILMGHIHDKEKCSNKAHYVGAAYQQNFSEDNNKGFTILYNDLTLKLVKAKFKEFIVQKVDVNFFTEEEIKNFISELKTKFEDKFLRIIFEGRNKDIISLKEYCKQLGIEVISKVINSTISDLNVDLDVKELDKETILEYFEEFASISNLENNVQTILKENIQNESA